MYVPSSLGRVSARILSTGGPCFLQSLVAFYLGRGDKRRAAAVFSRVSQLALVASVVVTSVLLVGRSSLPAVFTKDAAVMAQVTKVRAV